MNLVALHKNSKTCTIYDIESLELIDNGRLLKVKGYKIEKISELTWTKHSTDLLILSEIESLKLEI